MAKRILVVDDDEALGQALRRYLSAYGFDIDVAQNGTAMRAELSRAKTDLVILDLVLPDESGFDLAREIRKESDVPIIMLTGRGEEVDRVVGLELGADDFVTKPFSSRELLARVNAVLRRSSLRASGDGTVPEAGRTGRFCGRTIDVTRRKLYDEDGEEVRLTAGEFNVLLALIERPKRVLTREQILDCFMAGEPDVFDRSIDTRISRLRRKIEPDPKHPTFVKTEWGVGYFFDQHVEWEL